MKTLAVILAILLITSSYGAYLGKKARQNQHKPHLFNATTRDIASKQNITVHLIPHTHDDVGWLKTADQYYYGERADITWAGVRYIITSVVMELLADPTKNFIYVEVAFFKRWWEEQTPYMQAQVKQLVAEDRLEFINGGWVMNDEACVYYEDSIDQMALGHKFLLENFNITPTVGWHIDPFGHAAAQASLFSQMGFNAFYFARIDYQDKALRLMNQSMDMLWSPVTSQGSANNIFTSVNFEHYEAPPFFCFDIRCQDTPVTEDPLLEDFNVETMAELFVSYFVDMATHYQKPVLLHTLGSDFNYQAAAINFMNYDDLLTYIDSESEYDFITFKYSTPGKYLEELYSLNVTFPTKTDDFFPYADEDDAYWTGYFTSRVAVKGYVRQTGKLFQATKKLVSAVILNNRSDYVLNDWETVDTAIYVMEDAMATAQHHDAVTGTEKQAVANDYVYRLYNATQTILQDVVAPIIAEDAEQYGIKFEGLTQCNLNVSADQCPILSNLTTEQNLTVILYNPTQNDRTDSVVRVKAPGQDFEIVDYEGNVVESTIICANLTDSSDCDLFFEATVEQFSFAYYTLVEASDVETNDPITLTSTPYTIEINDCQSVTINPSNNTFDLSYCPSSDDECYTTSFYLGYNYYPSFQSDDEQNSGAYIFRPDNEAIDGSVSYAKPNLTQVWTESGVVTQISTYSQEINAHIRIYGDWTQGIEIETFVNSINLGGEDEWEEQGKEVVIQLWSPSINNNNTFYTDSMGMEMQQRIFNYRPTWDLIVLQNVSGNYYPINSAIYIEDTETQERMTVCNDRSQAGGSISNGEIELMIHRRLVDDDARGVAEPLDELDWDGMGLRQYVKHFLLFSKPGYIQPAQRTIQFNNDQPIQVFLANPVEDDIQSTVEVEMITRSKSGKRVLQVSNEDDEEGADLVKIYARAQNLTTHLIRFHNLNEDVSVNITADTFETPFFAAPTIVEMSLTGNQPREQMILNKYNWNNYTQFTAEDVPKDYLTSNVIQLKPLEIRTFLVSYTQQNQEIIPEINE